MDIFIISRYRVFVKVKEFLLGFAFFTLYPLTVWGISGIITKKTEKTEGGGGLDTLKRWVGYVAGARFGERRLDWVALGLAYLLPICGAIDGRLFTVAALLYLPIIVYVVLVDGLYLLYPVFFFFYSQLTVGGIVLFRLYTLAFMARTLLGIVVRFLRRERVSFSVPRTVFAAFLLLVALRYAFFGGFVKLGAVLDLCFLLCFALEYRRGEEGEKRFSLFCIFFVFGALLSCAVGLTLSSDGRYLATLNDPNYLGFYLNIAILTVFLHPFFGKLWLKLPILALLYSALIASESITGVICNGIAVLFCIAVSIFSGRFKLKYLVIPLVCGVVAVQFVYISQVHEWGMITEVSARVIEKLDALFLGDISGFTTSRSALWRINLEKFIGFDGLSGLFGGTLVSAVGRDTALFPQTSHQELLDALISCGAVGILIYLSSFAFATVEDAVNLRKTEKGGRGAAWVRIGIKLIWLFYAFGLTMFLNGRFFVPILI